MLDQKVGCGYNKSWVGWITRLGPAKLFLMERLWEDLSRRPSDVPIPQWHGDILSERQAAIREGRTTFVEWEAAKERLRARLN